MRKQIKGTSLELTNTHNDPSNSVSEICFFTHPRRHRTTTPTHGGITADPEILRYLRQGPVATPLGQIQRYFARLVLPSPHPAKDRLARHFVLTHDFLNHMVRLRLDNATVIAGMLSSRLLPPLSDPIAKGFTAEYRALTLGVIILPQRWLVSRKHELVKYLCSPDLFNGFSGIEPARYSF